MAIAVDDDSFAQGGPAVSSLSWSHTLGTADFAIVGASTARGSGYAHVSSVTIDTTNSFTAVSSAQVDNPTLALATDLWYILDASLPAAGTYTVSVNFDQPCNAIVGVVSLSGVNQAAPSGAATASGNSTTPSVSVSSASGEFVFGTMIGIIDAATTSDTIHWDRDESIYSAIGASTAGASTATINGSGFGSNHWSANAVPIQPAAGGGGDTNAILIGGDLLNGRMLLGGRLVQ